MPSSSPDVLPGPANSDGAAVPATATFVGTETFVAIVNVVTAEPIELVAMLGSGCADPAVAA